MCGIIGYTGEKEARQILFEGLKSMEYRGYDSSGLSIKNAVNLKILKTPGYVDKLLEHQEFNSLQGSLGIAHTRWATHGKPNKINAHPHLDCKKEIAIVHNGIIENYDALKEQLIKEKHVFTSETDSEVIAHLIEKFYEGSLIEAVKKIIPLIQGTFGILAIHKKESKIVAAKRGAPLLIGKGKKSFFVASDISAIIKHTNKIIYLEENQIAEIQKTKCRIIDMEGKLVHPPINRVTLKIKDIQKGNNKHFMLKEINEQPKTIRDALRRRLENNPITLSPDIDLRTLRKITLIGCGTSWHSALVGKYLLEKISGINVEVDYASEFRYRNPLLNEKDLVILISQSGETADTLAALREAKSKGAKTLGIVNVIDSSIAREVDSRIYLHAGPEISVASTKAFTSQLMHLTLLALHLRKKMNATHTPLTEEIKMIPTYIKEILKDTTTIQKIANVLKESKTVLYLGRGMNYPIGLEGALKLKEIAYIHAEGYPAAEIKHGPMALIDEHVPVIFLAPNSPTYEKILSNMQEVKARKGKIIAVVNEDKEDIKKITDLIIKVPSSSEEISTILNTIVLQLLAYFIADSKGINVDKPKNLAKSVTVE